MGDVRILTGDCRSVLRSLPDGMAQCCVTSPPYFGLRDYGVAGQIGLEASLDAYVSELVSVFAEVRRVLRDDGTLWLNLGDSYAGSWGAQSRGGPPSVKSTLRGNGHIGGGPKLSQLSAVQIAGATGGTGRGKLRSTGLKPKDLMMVPAVVALALRADGWWLRKDIIWHKPNPMPESTLDRPTSSHEHVFLFAKSEKYFYDGAAIRQPLSENSYLRLAQDVDGQHGSERANGGTRSARPMKAVKFGGSKGRGETANARDVWTIPTQPFSGAHFATMPPVLVERCVLAGSRPGDVVLDPFGGAGTTGLVASRLGRRSTLVELNPDYVEIARARIVADAPLLSEVSHG